MQHPSPPHPGVRACPEPAERGRDPAAPNNPVATRHPVRHAALALDPLHPPPPIRDAPPFVVSRPGVFRRVVSNHTLSYTSQAILRFLLPPFSQLTTLSSLLPHPVHGEPARSPRSAVSNHTAHCTQASLSVPLSFRAQRSGAEESRLISSPLPVLLLSTLTSLRSLLPHPVHGEPARSPSEARRACPEPVEGNHTTPSNQSTPPVPPVIHMPR